MPRSTSKSKSNTSRVKRRPKRDTASTTLNPDSTNAPEQKLGDTPVSPWEMPTPEEKAQTVPVRIALKEAVNKVDSQEKADEVIRHLESEAQGKTVLEVQKEQPKTSTSATAARKVQQAAQRAPEGRKTEKVLEETARALTTRDPRQREAVSQAAQEVLNPEQQGASPTVADPRARRYLRQAVLKRLKPLDALDASLFLKVNHLPHTRLLNSVFYGLTVAFRGGLAWYVVMAIAGLRGREVRRTLWREAALPMAAAGTLVELPIKSYFRRRRPFISIIQAIVIGKKPGGWSFPSGHSAVAFAGAWLLSRKYPRWSPLTYLIAGMVAFSRMYLGDHYPGDVASGSILGVLFAMGFNWLARRGHRRP